MESRNCKVEWKNHSYEISSMLYKLKDEKWHTDATITCDGSYYPVHKIILSASSRYLEELFQQTEKLHPLVHPVLVLNDVKEKELKAILNFIYLGEVSVPEKDLPKLLDIAKVLNIKGLCERSLRNVCSAQNTQNASVVASDRQVVNSEENVEVRQREKKRKLQEDTAVCENDVTSAAKRQMKEEVEEISDCTKKHGEVDAAEVCVNLNQVENAEDKETTAQEVPGSNGDIASTVQDYTLIAKEDLHVLGDGIRSSCTLKNQSKDVDETHGPDEDVFTSVGISVTNEPLPGPSGYSFTKKVGEDDHMEGYEGDVNINVDEASIGIKEEIIEDSLSEDIFSETETVNSPEVGTYMLRNLTKKSQGSETQENIFSDNDSNSSSSQDDTTADFVPPSASKISKELHIPDKDLPIFLKSYKIYKYSPHLSKQLRDKFWDQPGVQHAMIAIRNRDITLKKAARLLGPSYFSLYRQYSSMYGGIKLSQRVDGRKSNEKTIIVNPRILDDNEFRKVKFHECPHCTYKNPYKHNFLEHLKFHMDKTLPSNAKVHVDKTLPSNSQCSSKGEKPNSKESPSNEEELVSCDICNAKFAHLRTLRRHMQIHFHITPLECPFCSVKFDHKTQFTKHLEIHKNEKIFDCPICLEKFANRTLFNEHLKIHYQ